MVTVADAAEITHYSTGKLQDISYTPCTFPSAHRDHCDQQAPLTMSNSVFVISSMILTLCYKLMHVLALVIDSCTQQFQQHFKLAQDLGLRVRV